MEIIEFNKAFDPNELKGIIDKAMYSAAPVAVKTKWRNVITMILMNQNPTLAVKIKIWASFMSSGYSDATPEMSLFTNKILSCPDINAVRNIIYVEDSYMKWSRDSLMMQKNISNRRDPQGMLDAMLKVLDDNSPISQQVRMMVNDDPNVDPRYKHFEATIEKVLYNNGKIVDTTYTIAPDGVNVTIGGRKYVCGSGNALYLDPHGALRVSPKWRLVFLPDGNYAVEDNSHRMVIKGDLGTVTTYCGNNFGIDIVRVLQDNNIEANLSNNSSTGSAEIQERRDTILKLIQAKNEAEALLEQLENTADRVKGDYAEEFDAASKAIKKRVNAIDVMLYHYDIDPETGCPIHPAKPAKPVNSATSVVAPTASPAAQASASDNDGDTLNEGMAPLFDHIGSVSKDVAWIYDLLNEVASQDFEESEDEKTWTAKGTYVGKIKDFKDGIYGLNQISSVTEVSKMEVKCDCMRLKGDRDETYKDWSFTINRFTGEYTVTLESNPDEAKNIFDIYPNADSYESENSSVIAAFLTAIKGYSLNMNPATQAVDNAADDSSDEAGDEAGDEADIKEGANADRFEIEKFEEAGNNYIISVKGSGLAKLVPMISKYKPNSRMVTTYNGSLCKPKISIKNLGQSNTVSVAEITFDASDTAMVTIFNSRMAKDKTVGDIINL